MQCAHLHITGIVQGVGYRKFVKHHARNRGLTGWVRNNPDESVEAIIAGPKEKIEELIALCNKGPMLSEVDEVRVEWEEETNTFTDFVINHI